MGRLLSGVILFTILLIPACKPSEQQPETGNPAAKPQAVASEPAADESEHDPLGPNAACYVCHMTFVEEELAVTHLAAKVGCIDCHGLSADHANDEDIGATKPDVVIKGDKIKPLCGKCHETHNVPPDKVVARFLQRSQRVTTTQPSPQTTPCTFCHGRHKLGEF